MARRKRYGDSADVHTQKATAAARQIHQLAGQVVADASAGHCGLAIGELFRLQRALGSLGAHAGAGARVGTTRLQEVATSAGKTFLRFCTVVKK